MKEFENWWKNLKCSGTSYCDPHTQHLTLCEYCEMRHEQGWEAALEFVQSVIWNQNISGLDEIGDIIEKELRK